MSKVLVIQLSRMGDLIQTFPLLQRLKDNSAGCEITLVGLREFRAVVANQPGYDRFVALDGSDVGRLAEEAARPNVTTVPRFGATHEFAEPYDLVINLTHDEGSAVLCEQIRARHKSGRIHTAPNEIRLLGDWSKYLFAAIHNRAQNLLNLVDIYMGMGGVRHQPTTNWLKVRGTEEAEACALLREAGCGRSGKLVAFQMGASDRHRAWPVEHFAALADRLLEEGGVEIVLLGDQREFELSQAFARWTRRPVANLIGKTEVRHLAALLRQCALLISNDTGTIHLAAAVGARTVGLYFSTAYFAETAPYGAGHVVLQAEIEPSSGETPKFSPASRGADGLPVEAVLAAARRMLGRSDTIAVNYPSLAIYESTFLTNGTLIYAPLPRTAVSPHYWAGFLSRVMWERALGLATDAPFLHELLTRSSSFTGLEKIIREYRETLSRVQARFAEGAGFMQQVLAASSPETPGDDASKVLSDRLGSTVRAISHLGKGFGLLADFFHFEIMDMDFLPKAVLLGELGRKFTKLDSLAATLCAALETVAASLPSSRDRLAP